MYVQYIQPYDLKCVRVIGKLDQSYQRVSAPFTDGVGNRIIVRYNIMSVIFLNRNA